MTFTPVNDLEHSLLKAAKDPAARPAFYRALTQERLFVIKVGPAPEREETRMISEGTRLNLRLIDFNGSPYAAAFTSVDRIAEAVSEKVGYIGMQGKDLLDMLRGQDIVINPGAAQGKVLTRAEIESILDGSIFRPAETLDVGGKQIVLGQPRVYPRELVEALRRLFARSPGVKAAYLAHAFIPGVDKAPHSIIGVEVEPTADSSKIIGDAGLMVRELGVLGDGQVVDFVQVKPDTTDTAASYLRQETVPFYKRKRWFGLFG